MEMRNSARAAPVWDWRCFLRGSVGFYAQATGIQEENQIGSVQIPCFLVSPHWRFFGLLACLLNGALIWAKWAVNVNEVPLAPPNCGGLLRNWAVFMHLCIYA